MRNQVLWLSHFVPYPPKGGAFQRSYNLLREASRYYDVHLFAVRHKAGTHPAAELLEAHTRLSELCARVKISSLPIGRSTRQVALVALRSLFRSTSLTLGLYDEPGVHRDLAEFVKGRNFDLLHCDAVSTCVLLPVAGSIPKRVLNHHGAEGWMMQRRIHRETSIAKKAFFSVEARKLLRDERRCCPLFDTNIVCSDLDASLLRSTVGSVSFSVIANGVDTDYFRISRNPEEPPLLLFAGRLDQYANRDGIEWFCEHIWPQLKAIRSDIRLAVVGNNPPARLKTMAERDPSISVTGFVADVRPYFERAAAVVAPLRDGGGTRIKILDAWSMGMPIVATTIATEGLSAQPDDNLLIADNERDFVRQIMRILNDRQLAQRLGARGRETVSTQYAWPIVGKRLRDVYASLLAQNDL